LISSHGWRSGAAWRIGSCICLRNPSAARDNIKDKTKDVDPPNHAIKAPAKAGPPAKAMLLANSSRPLACAKCRLSTNAGTKDGALTLNPTVPTAATNPTHANKGTLIWLSNMAAMSTINAPTRNHSDMSMSFLRDMRSASKPKGMDNNKYKELLLQKKENEMWIAEIELEIELLSHFVN
jgi:hypothetical protein